MIFMSTIAYSDFQKLELVVGKIEEAEKVPNTGKLVKLSINIGSETRILVAGVADVYEPEKLVGKSVVVLANLEPKMLKGIESKGTILAAVQNGKPSLLMVDEDVEPGSRVM
jgi:methionine--tRNA ligase beta chain